MNYKHSESIKTILPALVKVQEEMPQLAKDKKNPHANSEYLTLDNILGSLVPLLNKNGIFLSQIPVENHQDEEQSIGVDTLLWHESGEYVLYPAVYYAFEKGGRMNMTQSVGSIITYSKRYALTSIFGISTNEDADGVQANIEPRQSKREKKWQEFIKHRDELFGRVTDLATESMQSTGAVNKIMLQRTGEDMGKEQTEITADNLSIYNKHLTLAEKKFNLSQAKAKKQEKNESQGSLLEGNTTKPNVEWGKKND